MTINSFLFWLVFPFIFLLYWVIPSSKPLWKKCFLILVSYLIYMSFFAWHALVLMYVTVITYWGARIIEKKETRRKATIWALLSASFAPLFFFKYLVFAILPAHHLRDAGIECRGASQQQAAI